jgi:dihydropteroate synthase
LKEAEKMLSEGADILDIGGQSTRPGAEQAGITEELQRVVPVIEAIRDRFPGSVLSVDTYHAQVASEAVGAGASLVNDISGGSLDKSMIPIVAALHVPYICMHMKGNPETMQHLAHYQNLVREVLDYFTEKKQQCRSSGVRDLILDPGFGFAKTPGQNFILLKNLSLFKMLGCPILLGLSRKSTIYKTLAVTAAEALNGTTVLNTIGLLQGADILRVHDVKEAREAIRLVEEFRQQ